MQKEAIIVEMEQRRVKEKRSVKFDYIVRGIVDIIRSMAAAQRISVDPASPSRKSGREPTFVLLHEDTSPLLVLGRAGPVVWNSLPDDIRNPELTLERFKTELKTHLFREAYA